jgi:hypothetical protein
MTLEINIPEVLAEVTAVFARYEEALVTNRRDVLDELFWNSPHTLRYGYAEYHHGDAAICAFRASLPVQSPPRELMHTVITTYGRDFATASTLFYRDGTPGRVGRQMQSWVRMAEGWRVVAAHVSIIDEAKET